MTINCPDYFAGALGFAALSYIVAPKAYDYLYPDYTSAFHHEVRNTNTAKAEKVFLSSPDSESAPNYISDADIAKGLYWFCEYSTQDGENYRDTIAFLDALEAKGRTEILTNLETHANTCFYAGGELEEKVFELVDKCGEEYCTQI